MQKENSYTIFYVALDPERATGTESVIPNYHVICPYKSKLTEELHSQGTPLFILEEHLEKKELDRILERGSYGMLQFPAVQKYIQQEEKKNPVAIIVLKTSQLIEDLCEKKGWNLWTPKAEIATIFENKLSQYEKLHTAVPFVPTKIFSLKQFPSKIRAKQYPVIAQFNIGHSGGGTLLIHSLQDIKPLIEKFPERQVRVSPFLHGESYTLNGLVAKNGSVYHGSISMQLTGLKEATNNPLATVGNDFQKPAENLTSSQQEQIQLILEKVGQKMHQEGYIGLFGIDVLVGQKTKKVYFIEVNTHQPASISFEAKLHWKIGKLPLFFIWIHDMMRNNGFIPDEELHPPLLLPFPAYQILYRNKSEKEILANTILFPNVPNVLPSRMKKVGENEELFRIQYYDYNR
ncbi:MAG: ATP-grasp domain-containing protein [Candidatus Wildermuthbacteria bacterium]|nr:ATP-grasp domain-containing protein [Candidatus Wildermuthbacteria bacterium]